MTLCAHILRANRKSSIVKPGSKSDDVTATRDALAAMELHKHVYVQKPLTWSVEEARKMERAAKETKVATQMGNQAIPWTMRAAVEYIWAGAIGEVREVHIWTNRPLGYEFPARGPLPPVNMRVTNVSQANDYLRREYRQGWSV